MDFEGLQTQRDKSNIGFSQKQIHEGTNIIKKNLL